MATSGSVNYSVTRADIITEALELLGVYGAGETLSADDTASCARTLEILVKAWQSENIGLWKLKEVTLFLQEDTYSYDIGPTGDNAALSSDAFKTEIATAAASGAGTITVDSDDNIADGDYIGVELDDGTVHWTTVNGAPAADVVTLTTALTDAAALDNHVYTYTTKASRPLQITEVRLHREDDTEFPLEIVSRNDYMGLSDKTNSGTPNQVYYDAQTTDGNLRIWPACADVKEYIKMTCRMPIEDFDSTSNEPDFPQEWFMALAYNLAVAVASKFGKQVDPDLRRMAYELKDDAERFDSEDVSVFFRIGQ